MIKAMGTTIRMNEAIARQVKALARETGETFTALVERACVRLLKEPRGNKRKRRLKPLPTANLGGLAPGVDPDRPNRVLADLDVELLPTLGAPLARAQKSTRRRAG